MHILQSHKRQKNCHNGRNQGGRVHPVKKSMWSRGRRPPPSTPLAVGTRVSALGTHYLSAGSAFSDGVTGSLPSQFHITSLGGFVE